MVIRNLIYPFFYEQPVLFFLILVFLLCIKFSSPLVVTFSPFQSFLLYLLTCILKEEYTVLPCLTFGIGLASILDIHISCYTGILHFWLDPESLNKHTVPKITAWRLDLELDDLCMPGF